MARCLEKDRDARPASANELIAALATVSTGEASTAVPALLLGGAAAFRRALLIYVGAFVAVAVLARAAIVGIGLPDWVFAGALVAMGLGLPIVLFTGYAQRVARRAATQTPTFTPGGSPAMTHGTVAQLALRASPHLSWRRAARGGAYALGAFAALVAGYMALRAAGIGPAGSLLAAGRLEAQDAVLVADFASRADTALGRVIADAVKADLGQSTAIRLVSDARVAEAIGRMQQPAGTPLPYAMARELALREGIKAIVDGEVTPLGGGYVVVLRLVTADSGRELASYRDAADSPGDLIATVGSLTRRLRGRMGESLKHVQASAPLDRVTTGSLEALRAYTTGVEANRQGDPHLAIRHLREALAIDSSFATAWASLAIAQSNAGFPRSVIDSALTRAYLLRDRLPESERYLAEATYFRNGPGRDRAKAIAAYERALVRGDTSRAANNLALIHVSRREFAKAESLYLMSIRVNPRSTLPWGNLLPVLLAQGKVDEAEGQIRRFAEHFPDSPAPITERLFVLEARGQFDEYRRLADSLSRSPEPRLHRTGIGALGWVETVRGQFRSSDRRRIELRVLESAVGLPDIALRDSVHLAWMDAWYLEQPERAVRRLDAALALYPLSSLPEADRPYFSVARAYTTAGRPDRARVIVEQMLAVRDTTLLRDLQGTAHRLRGEIALAEGNPEVALAEFRQVDMLPDGPRTSNGDVVFMALARAFDAASQPDSAIAYFERYLTTPSVSRANDAIYLAGTYKRLGELYEARGDRAMAASAFTRFVELWQDADPEVQPKVTSVRERLARLRDVERR